jgi:predicted nucleotidyltransferase
MQLMNTADHVPLEKITIKPVELQQAIEQAAAILKAAGADAVYVFGSIVEGPVRPDSDIDLAVAGLPPGMFFQAMGQTMFVLPRPLDLVDLDVDTPFTRYLKRKGKLHRVA